MTLWCLIHSRSYFNSPFFILFSCSYWFYYISQNALQQKTERAWTVNLLESWDFITRKLIIIVIIDIIWQRAKTHGICCCCWFWNRLISSYLLKWRRVQILQYELINIKQKIWKITCEKICLFTDAGSTKYVFNSRENYCFCCISSYY